MQITTNNPQPGDIVWCRTAGVMGKLIRLGEWIKFRKCAYNHECIVSDIDETGAVWVIQATMRGIVRSPLATLTPGGSYITMAPPPECDRAKIVEFMKAQLELHIKYGILTILAISIDILSYQWVPAFQRASKATWICSAVSEEAQRYAGWLYPWLSIYTVIPEQSYLVHAALA
jgi:hypothetical protein